MRPSLSSLPECSCRVKNWHSTSYGPFRKSGKGGVLWCLAVTDQIPGEDGNEQALSRLASDDAAAMAHWGNSAGVTPT